MGRKFKAFASAIRYRRDRDSTMNGLLRFTVAAISVCMIQVAVKIEVDLPVSERNLGADARERLVKTF
jgi:hypothetical protein